MKKKLSNYLTLLVAQCLLTASLFSQSTPPPKQWDKRFGGPLSDELHSLQQTKDYGYILGGTSYSGIGGDKTEDSRGGTDYWVVKTDINGIKQWDKRFGGTGAEYFSRIQQTADRGYILGGYSFSGIGGDKTEDSRGHFDYWVVKIDAKGIKQWDKRFGGKDEEVLTSVQQTQDGGYILGGSSYSGASGDKTQNSRGMDDFWIVKIDANGIKQWDQRFGGSDEDLLNSVQQTQDGGFILGGMSRSGVGGDKTQVSRGGYDFWIVKTDANGIKQWDKRFGGADHDDLYAVQQTQDGGFILAGHSLSGIGGDKTEDTRGGLDYWIVKTDSNGVKQWDKRFGGGNDDALTSLEQTEDAGYILGGRSYSGASGDKTEETRGWTDYWTVKTDANGVKQWDKRFGGTNFDEQYSLQQTKDGGYILGGWSSSDIGDDITENSRGLSDFWIVKLGCLPAINCKNISNSPANTMRLVVVADNIQLSPNPSVGNITITYKSGKTGNIELHLYDKIGKLMFAKNEQVTEGNNIYKLNFSNLPPGIYNLQVNNGSETSNIKFIIAK